MNELIPIEDEPFLELPPGIDFRKPGQRDPTKPKPHPPDAAAMQALQDALMGGSGIVQQRVDPAQFHQAAQSPGGLLAQCFGSLGLRGYREL